VRHDGTLSPAEDSRVREAIRRRDVDVIVGTRGALALASPGTLGVGALVLVDTVLSRPDFRAAERAFQQACRLGELVEPGGGLWLQSFYPDHPALTRLDPADHEAFYLGEHAEREVLGYPPCRRLALLLASGPDAPRLAADLAGQARTLGLDVLGPAALPAGRVQVVLLGGPDLPARVATAIAPLRGHRRVAASRLVVDVDPVELP
jgi:primosomal protein N' (replication factor Y)